MVAFQRAVDVALQQLEQSTGNRPVPAGQITISIEVAEPAIEVGAESFAELDERVRPGLEGLRLTIATQAGAVPTTWWSFPSQQMIAVDMPSRAASALISQVTGDPALALAGVEGHELADLVKSRAAQFARFRVAHIAELVPGSEPIVLTRGGVVVASRDITREAIVELRDRVASSLAAARVRMEPEGMRVRTLVSPALDRGGGGGGQAPVDASPTQVALLCTALFRTGREVDAKLATDLMADMLAGGSAAVADHASPVVAASIAIALSEYCAQTNAPRPWAADAVVNLSEVLHSAFDGEANAWAKSVPEPARGMVALALVRLATSNAFPTADQPDAIALAQAATRAAYRLDAPGLLVGQMPWLGWAEVELAEYGARKGRSGAGADSSIPAANALRQMRDALLARQVRYDALDVLGEDSEGGFLLASREGGGGGPGVLGPTWQSARPLAFMATMVRVPALTDEKEKFLQLARVLAGVRFLRQLTADEAAMHVAPWAKGARGGLWGVRNATWDQHQSLEAGVMTLFALEETLATIYALTGPAPTPQESPKTP
jgi:hypothetical protein